VRHSHDTVLPDGRLVSIEAIYVPDLDEGGAVNGFYALVMDVTERNVARQEYKRLQDELLHASRITTTGELAGTLAHEINQPLAAIMSNAQAARRFLDSPTPDLDEVREILQDIVAEDARAGEVIHRLRAFLKKSRTEFEPVDLNAVFGEVVGFVHSDAVVRDVAISLELDPRVPAVRGDRIQLQQVVLNLVLNAFDAVNAQPRGKRRILLRTGREGGLVHATVTDSGKGIPAEELETVFTPFFTTKPQGLGMGLSISRSIIARHQGRIWVESHPDAGATFRFSLPAALDGQTPEGT
jgi:two-component system sensor kinase FixL